MNVFAQYIKEPTESQVVNTKLLLLTMGLDVNFENLRRFHPDLKSQYKVNKVKVSDRHFIAPGTEQRDYIPDEIIITKNDQRSVIKVYYSEGSPLMLSFNGKEFVIIDRKSGLTLPVNIDFVPLRKYAKNKIDGMPLDEFVSTVGMDRVTIVPFDGCEHWLYGDQCKFCGAKPGRMKLSDFKPNVSEIKENFDNSHKKWWESHRDEVLGRIDKSLETFLYQEEVKPHFHFMIISGNLLDMDLSWEIGLDIAKVVNNHVSLSTIDSHINLMPPRTITYVDNAKNLGFRSLDFNLETFGREMFEDVCPGKYKYCGYEQMLDAFRYGVRTFGKGNVRTNFVLGSEPIEKTISGATYLAEIGVIPDYSVFFPRPGSVWHAKSPLSPDEILGFTKKLVNLYRDFDFRPFCCELSSRSSIANECYKGWV